MIGENREGYTEGECECWLDLKSKCGGRSADKGASPPRLLRSLSICDRQHMSPMTVIRRESIFYKSRLLCLYDTHGRSKKVVSVLPSNDLTS